MAVALWMPDGIFTFDDFVDHATGLNAIDSTHEVGPMLQHLTENEMIRRVATPAGQPQRWRRCA